MSFVIRPIAPEEFDAFVETDSVAFGYTPDAEATERTRQYLEFDRTLAAFDRDEMVATTCIFSFDMTVPGGALPAAGVSWVSVLPTHTRRGILTALMRRQINDVFERGEPIAALWASESLIYGRFGYGLAAQNARLTIDRRHTALMHDIPSSGKVRLVDREEALERWPACHERARHQQPGWHSRSIPWWQYRVLPDRAPERSRRRILAQYEEHGQVLGYARYEWGMNWVPDQPVPLDVQELVAETPAAYAALWKLIFSTDLVTEVRASHRSPDEPLYHMLADPRRLRRSFTDSLWLRIVDVPRTLEGRQYSAEGCVTLAVHDDFYEWAGYKYTLTSGPDGAACQRTMGPADVSLHARDLAAVYLGGTRLATLAAAGRVEGDPRAIALADRMFAWHPQPFSPEVF